ncbi:hypothetical protein BDV93DRAFT_553391 [Ceratobasidium sp. AG-I]|nr:hypothetical protein BDV93DRAFT_553391 [Ceratobasidium sp. AG-I]
MITSQNCHGGLSITQIQHIPPNGSPKSLERTEYYSFRAPWNKLFLWVHLVSVLPAALLAVLRFVPRIQARAIGSHRTAGKVINILTFTSTITAWGVAHAPFGGGLTVRPSAHVLGAIILWCTIVS